MSDRILTQAITFDDVLLVPAHSRVVPKSVSVHTQLTAALSQQVPLISAAMDTVTEHQMAISMAQEGGLGIIHKNMSIEAQAQEVRRVKKFESGIINDPVTIRPEATLADLFELLSRHQISGVPVTNEKGLLVGIVTKRDWRFETNMRTTIASVMTPHDRLVTVLERSSKKQMHALLQKHRLEKLPIVSKTGLLKGMITVKDLDKEKDKPLASKDKDGKLRVGAAVGTAGDTEERIAALVEAGVDVLVVDTAHGHSQGVLDRVSFIKKNYPQVPIIAGNIATAEAAKALAKAGAEAVKVGIGPGSICTTRVVTGVGMPQITAIMEVAKALKNSPVKIIADGGVRYSGDIAKAIAAGAHCVMIGSMFAGTDEAPGEIFLYQGRSYKGYRGMGSLGAMASGSSDRYFQDNNQSTDKFVPEGIEGRVPYKGKMLNVVHQLMGGLRSAMGYTGCPDIESLRTKAKFVQVSLASVREGHVHDVTITQEAPNYQQKEL